MINRIRNTLLILGLLMTSMVFAQSKFPIDQPVGGEPFGHSVTEISDGLYVFQGVPEENWLPINRADMDLDLIMRLYAPDLEKYKSWTTPKAKKL